MWREMQADDRVEVAAWTIVLSTLMNFDEVVRLVFGRDMFV